MYVAKWLFMYVHVHVIIYMYIFTDLLLKKYTICDYLEILMTLIGANHSVRAMASYLSDSVLLHPEFERYAHTHTQCILHSAHHICSYN